MFAKLSVLIVFTISYMLSFFSIGKIFLKFIHIFIVNIKYIRIFASLKQTINNDEKVNETRSW